MRLVRHKALLGLCGTLCGALCRRPARGTKKLSETKSALCSALCRPYTALCRHFTGCPHFSIDLFDSCELLVAMRRTFGEQIGTSTLSCAGPCAAQGYDTNGPPCSHKDVHKVFFRTLALCGLVRPQTCHPCAGCPLSSLCGLPLVTLVRAAPGHPCADRARYTCRNLYRRPPKKAVTWNENCLDFVE